MNETGSVYHCDVDAIPWWSRPDSSSCSCTTHALCHTYGLLPFTRPINEGRKVPIATPLAHKEILAFAGDVSSVTLHSESVTGTTLANIPHQVIRHSIRIPWEHPKMLSVKEHISLSNLYLRLTCKLRRLIDDLFNAIASPNDLFCVLPGIYSP